MKLRTYRPIGLATCLLIWVVPQFALAVEPVRLPGAIAGLVTDAVGVPQKGATVFLYNRQDRLQSRVLTDEKGAFSIESLAPDAYSVRVTLANLLPAIKNNIFVQAGARSLLNVSLSGLFSSIQLVYPLPEQGTLMTNDWKSVLRTASATRPVLRLLPLVWDDPAAQGRQAAAVFSDTRALVKVSAGDGGRISSLGNEADLGTAFALATSLFGNNQLQFSGNVGFGAQSGLPSAAFRTSYSRSIGLGSPEVSVTMRQLFVPGRMSSALTYGPGISGPGGESGLPALRTMSVSLEDTAQLMDALQLRYGFSLDSVSFLDRLNYFSPFAWLTYSLPDESKIEFTYTSGNARPDLAADAAAVDTELQSDIKSLGMFPRVSLRRGRPRVQRGEDFEVGYSRRFGSREIRVAGYRERVTNATLSLVSSGSIFTSGDILPDLFSNTSVFNAGEYHSVGATAAFTQNLGEHFNIGLLYGSVGALTPANRPLETESPDELRSMIHSSRRQTVTARISGTLPQTGTHLIASYQWTDRRSATPGHLYSTLITRPDIGVNIYVRQPVPNFAGLPWRMEATADLRNLRAEGYLPLYLADGRRLLLVHTPRSVRGGLSFIF